MLVVDSSRSSDRGLEFRRYCFRSRSGRWRQFVGLVNFLLLKLLPGGNVTARRLPIWCRRSTQTHPIPCPTIPIHLAATFAKIRNQRPQSVLTSTSHGASILSNLTRALRRTRHSKKPIRALFRGFRHSISTVALQANDPGRDSSNTLQEEKMLLASPIATDALSGWISCPMLGSKCPARRRSKRRRGLPANSVPRAMECGRLDRNQAALLPGWSLLNPGGDSSQTSQQSRTFWWAKKRLRCTSGSATV